MNCILHEIRGPCQQFPVATYKKGKCIITKYYWGIADNNKYNAPCDVNSLKSRKITPSLKPFILALTFLTSSIK